MLSATDLRKCARASLRSNWGTVILAFVLVILISSLTGAIAVGWILIGPIVLGWEGMFLKLAKSNRVDLDDVFDGFKYFLNAFLLNLLQALFLFLWMLLLVFPAIIKSYAYSMSYFIMADNPGITATQAITQSRQMMDGNKWRLFCLDLSFIGWYLLSVLTLGILLLWVIPYHHAAKAQFYLDLLPDNGDR